MKINTKVAGGLFVLVGFIFNLHSQEASIPDATSVAAMSDLEVMLQAVEMTTPMPAAEATNGNNFYSIQHNPESAEPWPPLPADVPGLPVFDLGNGFYLLDDRNYVWGQHKKRRVHSSAASATTSLSGGMMTMDDVA